MYPGTPFTSVGGERMQSSRTPEDIQYSRSLRFIKILKRHCFARQRRGRSTVGLSILASFSLYREALDMLDRCSSVPENLRLLNRLPLVINWGGDSSSDTSSLSSAPKCFVAASGSLSRSLSLPVFGPFPLSFSLGTGLLTSRSASVSCLSLSTIPSDFLSSRSLADECIGCASEGNDGRLRELLEEDLELLNHCGDKALNAAAVRGHVQVVDLLLECPAIDVLSQSYSDTLKLATNAGHSDVVDCMFNLLQRLTSAEKSEGLAMQLAQIAEKNNHTDLAQSLRNRDRS